VMRMFDNTDSYARLLERRNQFSQQSGFTTATETYYTQKGYGMCGVLRIKWFAIRHGQ
jgi:hypothetical protein